MSRGKVLALRFEVADCKGLGWTRDPPKFKSLLTFWLDKSQARGEDFLELNARLAAFYEYNWSAWARETYSWEELR